MAYDNSVINSMIINSSFYCILLYCTLPILLLLQMEDLWQFCVDQVYQYHFFNSIIEMQIELTSHKFTHWKCTIQWFSYLHRYVTACCSLSVWSQVNNACFTLQYKAITNTDGKYSWTMLNFLELCRDSYLYSNFHTRYLKIDKRKFLICKPPERNFFPATKMW